MVGSRARVGFLGAGYIAEWHARALRSVPSAALVAVCDKNPTAAGTLAGRYGVRSVYTDLDAMLAAETLDCVHILLPAEHHARAAEAVLVAGRDVVLEKPMAVVGADCKALLEVAEAAGRRVFTSHNMLFAEPYETLREQLRAGVLGRLDHIEIVLNKPFGPLQAARRGIWALAEPGNVILEVGPHSVAHLLDLLGRPEALDVRTSSPLDLSGGRRFYRRWRIDAYRGDACASLAFSFHPGFAEHYIRVRGTVASATVDFERNTFTLHRHTRYSDDFDRYQMLTGEAVGLRRQARRNLGRFLLSSLRLAGEADPYGRSFVGALRSFYAPGPAGTDPRTSDRLGRDVVEVCAEIAARARQSGPVIKTEVALIAAPSANGRASATVDPPARGQATPGDPPKVLVTGGSGFIGGELVRRLVGRGQATRLLVRDAGRLGPLAGDPLIEPFEGDLSSRADIAAALEGIEYVYHLAFAKDAKTRADYDRQEVQVAQQLGELCLERAVKRLFYTSTISVYDPSDRTAIITEKTQLYRDQGRRNNYALAKAVTEEVLIRMHRESGLPVVIFRPGIVIGRGGGRQHGGVGIWRRNGAICQFMNCPTDPLPIVLVEDLAVAMLAALDVPKIEGETYNLVGEPCLNTLDYLEAVERFEGTQLLKVPTPLWRTYALATFKWMVKCAVNHPGRQRPSLRDLKSSRHRARYDCSKAKDVLRWTPAAGREEVIRRGIQF